MNETQEYPKPGESLSIAAKHCVLFFAQTSCLKQLVEALNILYLSPLSLRRQWILTVLRLKVPSAGTWIDI